MKQSNAKQRHDSGKQCKETMIVAIVWSASFKIALFIYE